MQRIKLLISLIFLVSLTTGCFTRFPITNAIQHKEILRAEGQPLPVSIEYLWPDGNRNDQVIRLEYRDRIASLMTKDGYEFIYHDETVKNIFTHRVNVEIKQKHFGDAGASLFTGLSLGIIPSVEHRDDFISVEVSLLEREKAIDTLTFSADVDMYGGLIFIPFFFLNQSNLEVISSETYKAINTLIAKNKISVEIVESSTSQLFTPSQTNENTEYLIQQILTGSIESRIIAAKRIVRTREKNNSKLYDTINDYILENHKKVSESGHSIDEIAWLCKALATSGEAKYKETLYQVYKNSNSFNLRRHARKSLNFVDEYAEGKLGFDKKFIDDYLTTN